MLKEIIKASDYGLEEAKGNELTVGLNVVKAEREILIQEFDELSKLELLEENISKFKELRLKIVKNRTQGINKWHKANKEFFLTGGKFVDAIKNKENDVNERMEEYLMNAEKHFENIEKERLLKLHQNRVLLISEYFEEDVVMYFGNMEEDVWNAFFKAKQDQYFILVEAKLKAENERIEKEKAEIEEQKRIKAENEKLKIEAEKLRLANEKREKEIEDERIKQQLKIEETRKLNRIESEKEAKKQAAILAEEQAKRKVIEDQLKAENEKREKEIEQNKAIEAEKLKAKEQLESAPDKEKLLNFANELDKIILPELTTKKSQKLIKDVEGLLKKVSAHIREKI